MDEAKAREHDSSLPGSTVRLSTYITSGEKSVQGHGALSPQVYAPNLPVYLDVVTSNQAFTLRGFDGGGRDDAGFSCTCYS